MIAVERESGQQGREGDRGEVPCYCEAFRFRQEATAGRAYFQAGRVIFNTESDLSVFRMRKDDLWHIAILGAPPPENVDRVLRLVFSSGERVLLSSETVERLQWLRARAAKFGPWVERSHLRPGVHEA